MGFTVKISKTALANLKSFDKPTSLLILSWLNKNIQGSLNPRVFGNSIEKYHLEKWVYRIGSYRILSLIQKDEVVILTIKNENKRK